MKIIKRKLLKNIIIPIIITICILNFSFYNDITGSSSNSQVDDEFKTRQLKNAGSWIISTFSIDDTGGGNYTWAEAVLEDWCSGSGTFSDPYKIENITVNGGGTKTCIDILNSDVYFIIQNCNLYNSGIGTDPFYHAGIRFYNVSNALIFNNTIYNHPRTGIRIYYQSYNNTVLHNYVNNSYVGIYLRNGCKDNFIINNTSTFNTRWGMELYIDCDNNTLTGNMIHSNGEVGIQIYDGCDENFINNNTVIGNTQYGIRFRLSSYNNIVYKNAISNNPNIGMQFDSTCNNNIIYYNYLINNNLLAVDDALNNNWDYEDIGNYWSDYGGMDADDDGIGDSPYTISGTTGSQDNYPIWNDGFEGAPIFIDGNATGVGAHNWTWASSRIWCVGSGTENDPYIIQNLEIDGQGIGNCIEVRDSDKYFIIRNCTAYNSGSNNQHAGIKLGSLKFGNLIDNYCFNNEKGIRLGYGLGSGEGVKNCTIINNNCSDNRNEGILVVESSYNIIQDNFCLNNTVYGISIAGSSNNTVINNTCLNNSDTGIWIWEYTRPTASYNNTIMENILKYNNYGVAISDDTYCHNNLIHQNFFIDNNFQALDDGINNQWDTGSNGNYWSDYGGYDTDDDGIGDTPYNIGGTAGSQDNYPIWEDGDDLPPSINILSPTSSETFGISAPAFIVEIKDPNLASMWYTIDGGLKNITFTTNETINQDNWINLPDGPVTLVFYANDTLGHLNFSQVVINKLIPIIINIIAPTTDQLSNSDAPNFIIELSGGNSDAMWYTINNGLNNFTFTSNGTINQAAWISMPDGTITIKFYANNTIGNVYSTEITVIKDTEAPIISIIDPSINDVFEFSPAYEITITELNLDTIWYTLDGGVNNFTVSGLTGIINQEYWESLRNGYITLRFYANDTLGHLNFDEVIIVKDTPTRAPGIPGYDIFLLLGFISLAAAIIMEFKYHKKIN